MVATKPGCLSTALWTLGLVAASVVALYIWRVMPGHTFVGAVGTEIQYDDFAFKVLGAETVPVIGAGAQGATADGEFVIVRLAVINHAVRVDFTLRPEIVRLLDADGREFTLSASGQAALAALGRQGCSGALPAGGRCETELAFDVPRDAGELQVRLAFGSGLFDLLDTLVYGNRRLELH